MYFVDIIFEAILETQMMPIYYQKYSYVRRLYQKGIPHG